MQSNRGESAYPDDLLATGGCAKRKPARGEAGGIVAGLAFIIELTELNGRERLQGTTFSLLEYRLAAVRRSSPRQ
jgi:adenine/guanine phosphoribosyltransferase-like PRPP-binding protein